MNQVVKTEGNSLLVAIFVCKKTVLNLDFICNFDNFRGMKQESSEHYAL